MILTARDPDRLHRVGLELGASISAFDLDEPDRLTRFFANLPGLVDHVLVSGAGPRYVSFAELDIGKIRQGVERIVLSVQIARLAKDALQPTGSLLLIGGTGGRRPSAGPLISAVTAAMPALARSLALELAPVRVNVIAPGFVDTPLSASILGDGLDARREQLRGTLPIRRVVGPEDVADARRRPDDEHRRHRSDVRHRRRPTTNRDLTAHGGLCSGKRRSLNSTRRGKTPSLQRGGGALA